MSHHAWEAASKIDEFRMCGAELVDLGRGAASLGRWDEAILAEVHGASDVLIRAEAGLAAAAAQCGEDHPPRISRRTSEGLGDAVALKVIDALRPLRPMAA